MSLTDVVSGAMAEARDEGVISESSGVDADGNEEYVAPVEDSSTEVTETSEPAKEDTSTAEKAKETAQVEADAEKHTGKTAAEILKEELGPDKNVYGKENKIPHSRVVKIVDNQVTARLAPIAAALGVDAKSFTVDTVLARLENARSFETEVANNRNVEHLMETNPEMFLRTLASHHRGYQKFIDFLDNGGSASPSRTGEPRQQEHPVVNPTNDPEPLPDLPITNDKGEIIGQTYSMAGLKKRDEWRDRQMEARIWSNPKLKKVLDRNAAAEQEAAAEPWLRATMRDAHTWDGFTENQDEILAVLAADTQQAQVSGQYKHDLNTAYRKVVPPKLRAAREKAEADTKIAEASGRKKALEEVKKRPVSTSVSSNSHKSEDSDSPRSLVDVVRAEVAKMKGGRS